MTVSNPGSSAEKQADSMADKVVNRGVKLSRKEEENVSAKLHRQEEEETSVKNEQIIPQEEEETSAKSEQLNMQEEEEAQTYLEIQAQEEEEEPIQSKAELLRQEEEEAQTIPEHIQRKEEGSAVPVSLESRIKAARTGGLPLQGSVKEEMEKHFGYDFSRVRIHIGKEAELLCRELKAQAFTSRNHIFFNRGRFNPDTSAGKHLLTHELTHIVQQRG